MTSGICNLLADPNFRNYTEKRAARFLKHAAIDSHNLNSNNGTVKFSTIDTLLDLFSDPIS